MVRMIKTALLHYMLNEKYETNIGLVVYGARNVFMNEEVDNLDKVRVLQMPDEFGRLVELKILPRRRLAIVANFHLTNVFTIARRGRILAVVKISGNKLTINDAYVIQGKEIVLKSDCKVDWHSIDRSKFLHIELGQRGGIDFSRIDMSVARNLHCAVFFGMSRLLSVTYQGEPTNAAYEELVTHVELVAGRIRAKEKRAKRTCGVQISFNTEIAECQTIESGVKVVKDVQCQTHVEYDYGRDFKDENVSVNPLSFRERVIMMLILATFTWLMLFLCRWIFGVPFEVDDGTDRMWYDNETSTCVAWNPM